MPTESFPALEPQYGSEGFEGIDFEKLPNVSEFMVDDGRVVRSAARIEPDSDPAENQKNREGLIPTTLIIGGIPRGSENNPDENLFSPAFGRYSQWSAQDGVRAVVMNPAGMGRSEGNTYLESLSTRIDAWTAAAKHLVKNTNSDPSRFRIIGNSMGGHVAARLTRELPGVGINVDRLALVSPYFYGRFSEVAKFGPMFAVSHRLTKNYDNSPAMRALRSYQGELLLTFARSESPIPDQIQTLANNELATAIEQGRGIGYGLHYSAHNYQPLGDSALAKDDALASMEQSCEQIVRFLVRQP